MFDSGLFLSDFPAEGLVGSRLASSSAVGFRSAVPVFVGLFSGVSAMVWFGGSRLVAPLSSGGFVSIRESSLIISLGGLVGPPT